MVKQIKYTIYTEDKNREVLLNCVSTYFGEFITIASTGFWKGAQEHSLIIEIIAKETSRENVHWICNLIKQKNEQEAILVTERELDIKFL